MSDYILSCSSTADLSAERMELRDISLMALHYAIGGTEYMDDKGKTVPYEEFYARMAAGEDTHTSQCNIAEYMDYFTPFLEQGKDVVHIEFSSALSGTYSSAKNAAQLLKEQFPERTVYVIDSRGASGGHGLLTDLAADRRDEGATAAELAEYVESIKLKVHHWFFSTDLSYYVRGGRISKAAAVFGGMLEICPLLNMDEAGHLVPREKIRTKKRVMKEIVNRMEKYADNGTDYSGKCILCHAGCYEDARAVADAIEQRFPKLDGGVTLNWIGTTVGAHTGPGTVAVFFLGEERRDQEASST